MGFGKRMAKTLSERDATAKKQAREQVISEAEAMLRMKPSVDKDTIHLGRAMDVMCRIVEEHKKILEILQAMEVWQQETDGEMSNQKEEIASLSFEVARLKDKLNDLEYWIKYHI